MCEQPLISTDPAIRFGQPCITGTRITVADVRAWLANGQNVDTILHDFPELTEAQIQACIDYS